MPPTVTEATAKRFALHFTAGPEPELAYTNFNHPKYAPTGHPSRRGKRRGSTHTLDGVPGVRGGFDWCLGVKIFSCYMLRCAAWAMRNPDIVPDGTFPCLEGPKGSPAGTFNYAMSKGHAWLKDMFGCNTADSGYYRDVFHRSNPDFKHGAGNGKVEIRLIYNVLPPSGIEVFTDGRQLASPDEIGRLVETIEASCGPKFPEPMCPVRLVLGGDYPKDWEKKKSAFEKLFKKLGFDLTAIEKVEEGSIKLTLRLSQNEFERLFWAVHSGQLDELDVKELALVQLSDKYVEADEERRSDSVQPGERERIRSESTPILSLYQEDKLDQALWSVENLIDELLGQSRRELAARILCHLSKRVGRLGITEHQLQHARRAIDLAPEISETHHVLGLAYRSLHQFGRALQVYDHAVVVFPNDTKLHCSRAEILKRKGWLEQALNAYDNAVELFPRDEVVRCGRAGVLKVMGRPEEALHEYNVALDYSPKDRYAHCARAQMLKAMGRFSDALDAYEAALRLFPNYESALCGRAEVLKAMGQLPVALEAYNDAVERCPHLAIPYRGRAELLKEMDRLDESLTDYKQAASLAPRDEITYCGLAGVHKALGNLDDAISTYKHAIQVIRVAPCARNGLATTLMTIGNYAEAEELLPTKAPKARNDWIGLHILGMIRLKQNDLEGAQAIFRQGLECPFADQRQYYRDRLAVTLTVKGEYAEAEELLAGDSPKTLHGWIRLHILGMIRLKQNDLEGAQAIFRQGLECPFAESRPYFRSALAIVEIRLRNTARIAELIPDLTGHDPLVAVIRLHACGELQREAEARAAYDAVHRNCAPPVIALRDELAARYLGASPDRARKPEEWIYEQEWHLLQDWHLLMVA